VLDQESVLATAEATVASAELAAGARAAANSMVMFLQGGVDALREGVDHLQLAGNRI